MLRHSTRCGCSSTSEDDFAESPNPALRGIPRMLRRTGSTPRTAGRRAPWLRALIEVVRAGLLKARFLLCAASHGCCGVQGVRLAPRDAARLGFGLNPGREPHPQWGIERQASLSDRIHRKDRLGCRGCLGSRAAALGAMGFSGFRLRSRKANPENPVDPV